MNFTEADLDDVVESIFSQLIAKDEEIRSQAANAADYDRRFKAWLRETLRVGCASCDAEDAQGMPK